MNAPLSSEAPTHAASRVAQRASQVSGDAVLPTGADSATGKQDNPAPEEAGGLAAQPHSKAAPKKKTATLMRLE
jgi:hypothetical protein